MTLEEFKTQVEGQDDPPSGMPDLLQALWYDRKGNWDRAHEIAQDVHEADGSWVHAYLHRREGDLSNARYWYRRAGRPASKATLEEEWEEIAEELLSR